ncbi:MAG: DnaD domain protein [Leptolinea sp.]|nr:DnaD domain protein [Leptolinea sp.]
MKQFQGFPSGKTRLVPIPVSFFTDVVPYIDDLNTLKIMLHIFRALDHQDGAVRFVRVKDISEDETMQIGLTVPEEDHVRAVRQAVLKAVQSGFVLTPGGKENLEPEILFLNSPRGRDALEALKSGKWTPEDGDAIIMPPPAWPGIFTLYEDNIGPITPLMADLLQEAEKTYPQSAIQRAFEEAVKQNARNWKYVDAILRKWQEKGAYGQNSRDPEKDRRKYIEGEYAEFINHE